jgi:hypothetical protein
VTRDWPVPPAPALASRLADARLAFPGDDEEPWVDEDEDDEDDEDEDEDEDNEDEEPGWLVRPNSGAPTTLA